MSVSGDIFLPLFRYSDQHEFGFQQPILLTEMEMEIEMTEIIHREYTP